MMIPLAGFTVVVLAASNVSATTVSSIGRAGAMAKAGRLGIGQDDVLTGPQRLEAGRLGMSAVSRGRAVSRRGPGPCRRGRRPTERRREGCR
jgi:hypothetical protein